MNDVAIRVKSLSKRYKLGGSSAAYHTLRDQLGQWLRSPLRKLKSLSAKSADSTFWALKDVSFDVKRGEVIGVIGRNGAGKSTLLKILSRITEPTQGGADIHGRVGSILEVGTGFNPELTGRENVFLNGAILGMRRGEILRKFDDIVAFAEVEKFIDTPVKHYSSGMYMRLAFAIAAHLEPEILIVDEVLAVGDAQFQKKCLGKMGEVARNGRTVLFVSHDMGAIQTLCTSTLYLRSGQLHAQGPTREIVDGYLRESEQLQRGVIDQRALGPDLTLEKLRFDPMVIPTGGGTRVSVSLKASTQTSVEELCVLIYSKRDTRVAIIDLRSESGPYRLEKNQSVTIERQVQSMALVEGDYKIGLYINSRTISADFLELGILEIAPAIRRSAVPPYPASARGLVDLESSEPSVIYH